jgi:hypothetical protein
MKTEQQQRSRTSKKGAHAGAQDRQGSPTRHAASPAREPDPRERAENEGMNASSPQGGALSPQVEGEGSYSAAHRYQEGVERSVKKGDAEQLGEEAAWTLDRPEGEELRRAERNAKQGHASPTPVQKKTP